MQCAEIVQSHDEKVYLPEGNEAILIAAANITHSKFEELTDVENPEQFLNETISLAIDGCVVGHEDWQMHF